MGGTNQKFGTGQVVASHVDTLTLMLDYQSGKLSWVDNLGLIAQWIKSNQFGIEKIDAGWGIDANGNKVDNNEAVDGDEATKFGANGTRVFLPSDLKMGLDILSLHIELDNIASTGLNFSATHYINTITESGGVCLNPAGTDTNGDGTPELAECSSSKGYFTNSTYGGTAEKKAEGAGTLVALAWNSNMPMLMNAIVGAEYMTSDRDYAFFDFTADNLTSFYSNAGKGTHAYITLLPKNNLSFTLGYRLQEIEYSNASTGGLGQRSEVTTDDKISTAYARLRLDF